MYTYKFPHLLRWVFPNLIYTLPAKNEVYLTFDDGPIPDVTLEVLSILSHYQAKATFFCVGENIERHPEIFYQVVAAGHAVGNHTYHHMDGWKHSKAAYLRDIAHCNQIMQHYEGDIAIKHTLFRPPYGKITPALMQELELHYKVIMWDVISADFDQELLPEKSIEVLKKLTKPGSIIVFHDSIKAADNMFRILPEYLQFLKEKAWTSAAIPY